MSFRIERTAVAATTGSTVALLLWPAIVALFGDAGEAAAVRWTHPAALLSLLPGVATAWGAGRLLPASIDGAARRRPVLAALWTVLAVVTVVQTARFGAHLIDEERDWWITTTNPFWSKHACLTAYFYAADLDQQGEANVYDGAHYPGLTPDADVHPTMEHLVPEDPYQYPPQFLLLPRLAMAFSNDFRAVRAVWTATQALAFLALAIALARWYGGRAGRLALWLVPLLWVSVPSLLNFQYGQFHVTTIALAAGALVAFERRRDAAGGLLLAIAVLAKGFPGIVLLPMLLRRQWRPLGWTAGFVTAFTAVAWGVLGPEPFRAFFAHHVANLSSGSAFAFEEAWPELRAALLAGNVSPFAAVRKLAELGVPGITDDFARVVHGLYTAGVVVVAALAARLPDRRARVLGGLALVNLAAMTSPAAWGDYVPLGTLWLATLLLTDSRSLRPAWVWVAAGFSFLLPGVVPIGSWPGPAASMAISIGGTLLLAFVNGAVALRGASVSLPLASRPARRLAAAEAE